MLEVYFSVLVCLANCPAKDFKIYGHETYYSKESCLKDTRLIAKSLYEKNHIEYAYKCILSTYEPKELKD